MFSISDALLINANIAFRAVIVVLRPALDAFDHVAGALSTRRFRIPKSFDAYKRYRMLLDAVIHKSIP